MRVRICRRSDSNLGFTGAAGADAAALPGEGVAHAGQPGQQILILGQFHL